ncbi:MAG: hypothetical protein RLZZ459_1081 [Cyanobacteriota bacterium]
MNRASIGCKLFKPHPQPRGSDQGLAGSRQAKTSAVDLQANDAFQSASNANRRTPGIRVNRGTAAEQVLAAELSGRQENGDALAMMVSSMVHMVQAGKTRSAGNRWSA